VIFYYIIQPRRRPINLGRERQQGDRKSRRAGYRRIVRAKPTPYTAVPVWTQTDRATTVSVAVRVSSGNAEYDPDFPFNPSPDQDK